MRANSPDVRSLFVSSRHNKTGSRDGGGGGGQLQEKASPSPRKTGNGTKWEQRKSR